jgi:hypothetical protein
MTRLILIAGFLGLVAGAKPALAQPVVVSYDNLPKREFGVTASAWDWSRSHGEAGSIGGRYSRNLTDILAVEGGFDIGGMDGRAFAMPSVQVRVRSSTRPTVGPFFTMGLATSLADEDLDWLPRGRLLTIGGGIQGPVSGDLALRFDLQMIGDEHGRAGFRMMVGILGGRD